MTTRFLLKFEYCSKLPEGTCVLGDKCETLCKRDSAPYTHACVFVFRCKISEQCTTAAAMAWSWSCQHRAGAAGPTESHECSAAQRALYQRHVLQHTEIHSKGVPRLGPAIHHARFIIQANIHGGGLHADASYARHVFAQSRLLRPPKCVHV